MVKKIGHKELTLLIQQYYKHKIALIIYGRFGIGKSWSVKETSELIAKQKNRKFVEWNRLTEKEKQEVFDNASEYFVLIDIRLSEYSADDIKGLPEFQSGSRSIEFRVPFWALLLEKKESDGLLFFDELNLSVPLVLSSCYKIIYDRVINNSKINDNWGILGAGNVAEDNAYTHDIAPPLRDRCGEVELVGSSGEEWINNFALKQGINSRIISFISFKSSYLWKVDLNDTQKATTYRSWMRVNTLMKDIKEDDYDTLELVCGSAIGEGIASEFVSFLRIQEQVKIKDIIETPSKIREIKELSIKFFLMGGFADLYREDKIDFKKIVEISKEIDKGGDVEFVSILWRMCKSFNPDKFKLDFVKEVDVKFAEKYSKYICS